MSVSGRSGTASFFYSTHHGQSLNTHGAAPPPPQTLRHQLPHRCLALLKERLAFEPWGKATETALAELQFPAVSHALYETSDESFNLFPSAHLGTEGLVVGDCARSSHTSKVLVQQEKGRMLDCFCFHWSKALEWAD